MKIQVNRNELLRSAQIAAAPVNGASTIPILNNVLIEAGDYGVELRATDYTLRVKVPMNADVLENGAVTVPARVLADLVKSLPAGDVTITQDKDTVAVQGGTTKANLASMPAKDFPSWPSEPDETTLTLPAEFVRGIIDKVMPAVPTRDPRKVLESVCLDVTPESITAVATDGKILSRFVRLMQTGVAEDMQIIVPSFLPNLVSKLLGDDPVVMTTDKQQIMLDVEGVRYIANRVDGRYPNYQAVIPRDFSIEIDFPRNPMLAAVKRTAIMADRVNLHIDMDFADGRCGLTTQDVDRGRMTDTVGANTGNPFGICLNYKLLLGALSAVSSDTVTMRANNPTTPVTFQGADADDLMVLVMPIKKTEMREPETEHEEAEVSA